MRILLTNDDGIGAPGITALAEALAGRHQVAVAAPASEQSGTAHAVTVHQYVEVSEHKEMKEKGIAAWSIGGTPTDCVKLYLEALVPKNQRPELLISGINKGANLGTDVLYSGTVGGAMEGIMHGVPSIALSLDAHSELSFEETAAMFAERLEWICGEAGKEFFLNVNFPKKLRKNPPEFVWASLGHRDYKNAFDRVEKNGRIYYYVGGDPFDWDEGEQTDTRSIQAGLVTMTPLILDMTDIPALRARGIASGFSGRLAES